MSKETDKNAARSGGPTAEQMQHFEQAFERIKKATGKRTQVELAEVLGIRQSSISDAKRRSSVPSEWFLKLFRGFGLNPDWLEYGIEPIYLKSVEGQMPVEALESAGGYGKPVKQPTGKIVEVYALTGLGNDETMWAEQTVEQIYIPESFYKPSLKVVKMDGASMEPTIRRGAYVGVDEKQKRFLSGEIYAVFVPHQGLALKRVYFDSENDRFILRSEDSKHPEQYIPVGNHEERVLGRVIWILQEI